MGRGGGKGRGGGGGGVVALSEKKNPAGTASSVVGYSERTKTGEKRALELPERGEVISEKKKSKKEALLPAGERATAPLKED